MTVLKLALTALKSRQVRSALVKAGVRRFATSGATTTKSDAGLVSKIFNGFGRFAGFIFTRVWQSVGSIFTINWSGLWAKIVGGVQFLLNFNWNTTDTELDAAIKQANIAIAGSAGGTVGNALGFLICGGVPATAMAVFNVSLALHVLQEVGEEAAEEIAGNVAQLISLVSQQLVRFAFTSIFKNYRSIIRPAAINFARLLEKGGVLTKESVDKADKKRKEPWSIASALEDSIESIKDPIKKEFVEEFWDELGDACIEAGFIVAGSLDGFFAQQKVANQMYFGDEKLVEIQMSRKSTDELTTGLSEL